MRRFGIGSDEYYHLIVRGNYKQNIFRERRDYVRFIFLITHLQSPITINKVERVVSRYVREGRWDIDEDKIREICTKRYVELVEFTCMPNHVHLIVTETEEGGVSRYMQRTLNAYTKYFNTKYEVIGHLLQGPFRAVHVAGNTQLLHLSAYVHRNPRELPGWRNKEVNYPWSSYQDFVHKNRWGLLLNPDVILGQFSSGADYKKFVSTSTAKENRLNTEHQLF